MSLPFNIIDIIVIEHRNGTRVCTPLFTTFKNSKLYVNEQETAIRIHEASAIFSLASLQNQQIDMKSYETIVNDSRVLMTNEQLKSLPLKLGKNNAKLVGINEELHFEIYFVKHTKYPIRFVISDIDGTITQSDTRGFLLNTIGIDWTHKGVCNLYQTLANKGYHILYLSARPFSHYTITKSYLKNVIQDSKVLPDGPLILAPYSSLDALLNLDRQLLFKCNLFDCFNLNLKIPNLFAYGFGNHVHDQKSYLHAKVPPSHIFIIDEKDQISCEHNRSNIDSYNQLNLLLS